MAKISALTALARADVVDTDYIVVVDASVTVTKRMNIDSLLGALDGDQLDVDFTPTNYTPAATPAEADDVDDLSAHLYGVDVRLGELDVLTIEQADTTFTVGTTSKYVEIDTSGGAVTATLPSAATLGAGWNYILKITDATATTTVATTGAETIEGQASWQLTRLYETLSVVSDGTNWKILSWEGTPQLARITATYVDATSYTITPGCYPNKGGLFPLVYWDSTLTLGPDTLGAEDRANTGWHYLYIDDSSIVSPVLTGTNFLESRTAPAYSATKKGWYNGNDRAIFGFRVGVANTLTIFYHDGDFVQFDDAPSVAALSTDYNTSWIDITLIGPSVCRRFSVTCQLENTGAPGTDITYSIRTNGSSGTGLPVLRTGSASTNTYVNTVTVITDSSLIIEAYGSANSGCRFGMWQNGYYLPREM